MTGYLDWDSQPSMFKHYPQFLYRYKLDEHEALKPIAFSRCITSRSQIGGKPYYRLNTPSAGNLHPTELYVQIRGVEGIINGIYHVDVLDERLVLIQEIDGDGLEAYAGISPAKRIKGMVFIVSIVPFRSEWKYGLRAYRYCYLDAGHQIAAINAALSMTGQKCKILSNVDLSKINEKMGFGEHEGACMTLVCGEETERNVKVVKSPLMEVSPVDYTMKSITLKRKDFEIGYQDRFEKLLFKINDSEILQRRSARSFVPTPLTKEKGDFLFSLFENLPEILSAYIVLLRSDATAPGVYESGNVVRSGDFSSGIVHLLVDQQFITRASAVVVFTSKWFVPESLMQAGMFVHYLSLELQKIEVGCTGIGAFYDQKLQSFLETDESIIYVCTLGAES